MTERRARLSSEMHNLAMRYARQLGLLGPDEKLDLITERIGDKLQIQVYTRAALKMVFPDSELEKTAVWGEEPQTLGDA